MREDHLNKWSALLSFFLSFFCAIRWLEKRKIGAVSGVAALASWLNTRRSVTTVNRLLIIEQNCSVYPWHGICCIIRNRRRTKMTAVDAMAMPRRDAAGPVWMFISFLHHHFKPWLTWLQAPIKIAFVLAHENCLETRAYTIRWPTGSQLEAFPHLRYEFLNSTWDAIDWQTAKSLKVPQLAGACFTTKFTSFEYPFYYY